ncbi:MAG: sugar phosphate isomerase/epimerase [Gemmatimonadetes bacterium]|jgi:sugar phosphate isomerase/epimerase|nr:sugar phosphate isomerase/epimerase [Gemmatimonadota bacterium]MDE0961536.1 sugar phosphate isomerase/epimerase [Candidatus Latescibacterota bacterium]MBT5324996.1 sugar phosphate isomerase/epimerase [Gemmatimonadota bacterium]MBT5448284.1 sugar phosphate isomerase/epimerase [Gemmatimonadota bacterium]MBT5804105.1 sugar phosphate isomerase/epimerase [Gemmatimonadota bacterium]
MHIVLNSKFFAELSPEALADKVAGLGYDGVDLCVREGHPVDPENVGQVLPGAVASLRDAGLSCPLVSAPTTLMEPDDPTAEKLYAACAEAGVPRIKIGYWYCNEGDDYWAVLDRAKEGLAGFARLSERYGVQTCCHTHSGPCLGSNCAGLMHLIGDFSPRDVGAYPDFGHMALDGEDLAMGLSMIAGHLSIAAAKDATHVGQADTVPPRGPIFTHVGAGSVDWRRALRLLAEMEFSGPLVVHTEYSFAEAIIRQVGYAEQQPPGLEKYARQDAAVLRQIADEEGVE